MNNWYNISTSFNMDRTLSVFQQKKQLIYRVVAPIHNDNHIVMLNVFIPCDKIPNGQITIYDYLDSANEVKNFSAKMWCATLF